MSQRQKQTLPRERAHKNAVAGNWGAFNGPPGFAMGSHSAVTSFRSAAESSTARIEFSYLRHGSLLDCNDSLLREDTSSVVSALNPRNECYDRTEHGLEIAKKILFRLTLS